MSEHRFDLLYTDARVTFPDPSGAQGRELPSALPQQPESWDKTIPASLGRQISVIPRSSQQVGPYGSQEAAGYSFNQPRAPDTLPAAYQPLSVEEQFPQAHDFSYQYASQGPPQDQPQDYYSTYSYRQMFDAGLPTVQNTGAQVHASAPVSYQSPPQGSVPALSTCPTCSKPFPNEGRKHMYCSAGCNPSRSPSVPAVYKKCASCGAPATMPPSNVPADLQQYINFADSVCSVGCLRKLKELAKDPPVPCSGCMMRFPPYEMALKLSCGHGFHSKECLSDYLIKVTKAFTTNLTVACSLCQQALDFKQVFRRGEFDRLRERVKRLACCTCGSYHIKHKIQCGHSVCQNHSQKHRCNYCPAR